MSRAGASSAVIASGTLLSRLLGVVRSVVLVSAIGATGVMANSYATANQITNVVYTLVATGVLSSVLVPQITRASASPDKGAAYLNRLVTLALLGSGAIALLAACLMPVLMGWLGSNWPDARQVQLATVIGYWLVPQIVFFAMYTVLGEILHSQQLFGPHAWTPVLNNVVSIASLLVFVWLLGGDPDGSRGLASIGALEIALVAGGATLGVAAQATVLILFLRRAGVSLSLDFRLKGTGLGTTIKVGSWTFLAAVVAQLVALFANQAMNRAGAGEAGAAAWQLTSLVAVLPHSIFIMSMVTARFTRMSEAVHHDDIEALRGDLTPLLRQTVMYMMFFGVATAVLALPITRVLMARASIEALMPVAIVLLCQLVGMLPYSVLFVANRAFFAFGNTKTPFLLQFGGALISYACIFASYAFASAAVTAMVAFLTNAVFWLQALATLLVLRRRMGRVGGRSIALVLGQCAVAVFPAALLGLSVLWLLGGFSTQGFALQNAFTGLGASALVGGIMIATFIVILIVLRNGEALGLARAVRTRLRW